VTEQEWLETDDPTRMVEYASGRVSDRKLRLFLVAAARLVWHKLPVGELRDAVNAAEEHADGLAPAEQIDDYRGRFYGYVLPGRTPEQAQWIRSPEKWLLFTVVRMTTYPARMLRTLGGNENWQHGIASLHPLLPPLLRDVCGNPFRPICHTPSNMHWNNRTVRGTAQSIYQDRLFDDMPTFAEALEKAGCMDAAILGHCRGPGPHVRGCWVVDQLLGKE
jgi:hypothetical protein